MVKGPGKDASVLSGPLFLFVWNHETKEAGMQSSNRIKSYRRRCREMGKNTGLAHYILLKPKSANKSGK